MIFDLIHNKLNKLLTFWDNPHFFYRTTDVFIKRQQSQKTSKNRPSKRYHPSYFSYRKKLGFLNPRHSYFLTGELHQNLKFFYDNTEKEFYFSSSVEYLEYLFEGNLGGKIFPQVVEAWRFSEFEINTLIQELVIKYKLHVRTS